MSWIILALLLTGGLLFIAIEILFIPGITYVGVIGATSLILGIIYAFVYLSFTNAFLILSISLVLVAFMLWWVFKYGLGQKFSLRNSEKSDDGYHPFKEKYDELLHKSGIAVTDMRPSGKVKVSGRLLSAVTTGDFIEKNQNIQVFKIEGNKIIVTLMKDEE